MMIYDEDTISTHNVHTPLKVIAVQGISIKDNEEKSIDPTIEVF
jgi:hypothetical protein